jgi:hypothetical protein
MIYIAIILYLTAPIVIITAINTAIRRAEYGGKRDLHNGRFIKYQKAEPRKTHEVKVNNMDGTISYFTMIDR